MIVINKISKKKINKQLHFIINSLELMKICQDTNNMIKV